MIRIVTCSTVLLFQIVKNVFNTNVAIYSSIILSFTPLWVRNLHFMQPNIPVTFWTTLTIYFLILALKSNYPKNYIFSALFSGLSLSTKTFASIILLKFLLKYSVSKIF